MKKEKLKIEYVDIEKIKPNEYNPKQMTKKEAEDLEKSIVEFGIVDPLVVNSAPKRKGIIIGGHQRYKIYQKLGYKKVPVVYVNIPDIKREQELCLRLSKNTGSWDYDLLVNFSEDLLKDVGFENEELDEIFGLEIDDEFDVEKELNKVLENKERRCKEGDLWQLGEHRLYIGNATDRKSWEKVLGSERFDFLFTDPPYLGFKKFGSKGYEYLSVKKGLAPKDYDSWLSIANDFQNPKGCSVGIWENWKNVVKLWTAIEKFWNIKNIIIWYKTNKYYSYFQKRSFKNEYEIAVVGGNGKINEEYEKELITYLKENNQYLLDSYEILLYGQKKESYFDKRKGSRFVPFHDHISFPVESPKRGAEKGIQGTKPIQILVPYIKILSPRNGIVVDCFGGSGSTLIACEIMKRKCRMIEIEPLYAEVILKRWEKFTNKKAKKL